MTREELLEKLRTGEITLDDIDLADYLDLLDDYERAFFELDELAEAEEISQDYRSAFLGLMAIIVLFASQTPDAPTETLKSNVYNDINLFINTMTRDLEEAIRRNNAEAYRLAGGIGLPPTIDVLNQKWSPDGKTLNNRLLKIRNGVLSDLDTIIDNLSDGDITGALTQLEETFRTSNNVIKSLYRTEINYGINQAFLASMKSQGIEEYEYSAILDDRTSEICESLDGLTFKVADAEVAENYPPMHPNCRSTVIPKPNRTT